MSTASDMQLSQLRAPRFNALGNSFDRTSTSIKSLQSFPISQKGYSIHAKEESPLLPGKFVSR